MLQSLAKFSFSNEVRYTTHRTLRSKLRHLKKLNSQARIMGLDVGRKYTGLALSCKEIVIARGHKTIQMQSVGWQNGATEHDFEGLC